MPVLEMSPILSRATTAGDPIGERFGGDIQPRKVIMAQEVGFCFGVKRAIDLTRQALAESDNVFILGDLIHNKHVTESLEREGLRKVSDFAAEQNGTMVIRAHGLPKARIQEAKDQGLKIVDATEMNLSSHPTGTVR